LLNPLFIGLSMHIVLDDVRTHKTSWNPGAACTLQFSLTLV